jgi:hypothetical protein
MVLPCGYTDLMGVYKKDMAKSMILLYYYNNVYEGLYEKW